MFSNETKNRHYFQYQQQEQPQEHPAQPPSSTTITTTTTPTSITTTKTVMMTATMSSTAAATKQQLERHSYIYHDQTMPSLDIYTHGIHFDCYAQDTNRILHPLAEYFSIYESHTSHSCNAISAKHDYDRAIDILYFTISLPSTIPPRIKRGAMPQKLSKGMEVFNPMEWRYFTMSTPVAVRGAIINGADADKYMTIDVTKVTNVEFTHRIS